MIIRKRAHDFFLSVYAVYMLTLTFYFSWKVPETKQINKYTLENMQYYVTFLNWLQTADPSRLKFLDESHFQTKGMSNFFLVFITL